MILDFSYLWRSKSQLLPDQTFSTFGLSGKWSTFLLTIWPHGLLQIGLLSLCGPALGFDPGITVGIKCSGMHAC